MKRLSLALVPVLALGLAACQKQAAPERAADAAAPAATAVPAAPAQAGAPAGTAAAPRPRPCRLADGPPRDRVPPAPGGARARRPGSGGRGAGASARPDARRPRRRRARGSSRPAPPCRSCSRTGLTTKTAKPEDRVVAELAEDVVVDGDVLLPAGSEVSGHVVSAVRSGRVKGKARLVVSFDQSPGGREDLPHRRDRAST